MRINLKEICGKQTITRDDGKKINELIVKAWNKKPIITIDFNNILIASVSFMDEAFGKLTFEYSKETLKDKLKFENIENYDRALLNDILISRYQQKELGQNVVSRQKNRNSLRELKQR